VEFTLFSYLNKEGSLYSKNLRATALNGRSLETYLVSYLAYKLITDVMSVILIMITLYFVSGNI